MKLFLILTNLFSTVSFADSSGLVGTWGDPYFCGVWDENASLKQCIQHTASGKVTQRTIWYQGDKCAGKPIGYVEAYGTYIVGKDLGNDTYEFDWHFKNPHPGGPDINYWGIFKRKGNELYTPTTNISPEKRPTKLVEEDGWSLAKDLETCLEPIE